jgi:hypothetical protein
VPSLSRRNLSVSDLQLGYHQSVTYTTSGRSPVTSTSDLAPGSVQVPAAVEHQVDVFLAGQPLGRPVMSPLPQWPKKRLYLY